MAQSTDIDPAAADKTYASHIVRNGPVILIPPRRWLRGLGRACIGLGIVSLLPLLHKAANGEPFLGLLLSVPIVLMAAVTFSRGSRIEQVVIDEAGITVMPTGPFISADEIISIEEVRLYPPWLGGSARRMFRVVLSRPRFIPLIAPVSAIGRGLGIAGSDPSSRF